MPECKQCGKEVGLPFRCNFCGHYYCIEHRLPENHNCYGAPPRTPLGSYQTKRIYATMDTKEEHPEIPKYATIETEKPKTEKRFPIKRIIAPILLGILIVSVIFYAPTILHYVWNPSERELENSSQRKSENQTTITPKYTTSIYFEGFSLTQNGTHLIIEDHSLEWAPYYHISLKNGTRVLGLLAYEAKGSNILAEYAYVTREFAKEIYSLEDIFGRLPSGEYIFEIYTHNRRYSIIIDNESKKILFGNYSRVSYLPSSSLGNTIYEVVFKYFNETVFQRIKEHIFNNNPSYYGDTLDQIEHLVRWADLNVEYQYLKVLPYIYDPLTFMEKKEGVCIDYAIFYASGLFAIGINEAYIFIFNTTKGLHATAGVKYNNKTLILEQKLPVWEFQEYINNFETILDASLRSPIYAYIIRYVSNDFVIEFYSHFNQSS